MVSPEKERYSLLSKMLRAFLPPMMRDGSQEIRGI